MRGQSCLYISLLVIPLGFLLRSGYPGQHSADAEGKAGFSLSQDNCLGGGVLFYLNPQIRLRLPESGPLGLELSRMARSPSALAPLLSPCSGASFPGAGRS